MSAQPPQLIIAGGGLAGCLAALALAERRLEVRFLLLEEGRSFGGNHVWSFFDTDIAETERAWIAPLVHRHWPDHDVRFPARQRTLAIGYNSMRSADLDRAIRTRLRRDQYRLDCKVTELSSTHVVADGERIEADGVIDARGASAAPGLELAWQKFLGRVYRFERPHGVQRPVIMDALVEQVDGYRFVYFLPFSDTELMIEDTYYADDPSLDDAALAGGLDRIAAGLGSFSPVSTETGVLPIVLGGELDAMWPEHAAPVARLGISGGFFHPTTGYSLPDAVRNAALLCRQRDLTSPALHRLFRERAARLWDERRFFQLLNRMLFRAAKPTQRYRVLEHFYRLPLSTVARFYAAELTALDKVRILSGRPPVPVGKAIAAMRSKAA